MSGRVDAVCAAAARAGVQLWAENGQLRFRAPAQGLDPSLAAELRANREALIAFLGVARSASATHAQERLWFLDRATPHSIAYNLATSFDLRGALDVSALERTLHDLVARHEPLRTRFAELDGTIVQWIDPPPARALTVIAARSWDEAHAAAARESEQPFDLHRGPLHRVLLFTISATEHLLLHLAHHIVFDGGSGRIFKRELAAQYAAYANGQGTALHPLPTGYADYASAIASQDADAASLEYWKTQLAGAPPLLELPCDRPRRVASDRGEMHIFALDARGADALARRESTTLFSVFVAAFDVLLRNYVLRDDIVIGIPTAGRPKVELEDLIGMFVNTVALRCDLSGDPTFRELLARVTSVTTGAITHDVPFDRVVAELHPERHPVHNPIFQVILTVEAPSDDDALHLGEAAGPRKAAVLHASRFDLGLSVEYHGGESMADFVYRPDHFDPETIARMGEHFDNIVRQALADPGRRLSEIDMMSAVEREQVVAGFNDTAVTFPRASLHGLVAEQAARTPDAVAVQCGTETLTFAELQRRVHRLAQALRARGVGRNSVVGLLLDRTPDLVVSMLAVLEAGGAYLPLDREAPLDRIAYILETSGAALALTTSNAMLPASVARIDLDVEDLGPSSDIVPDDETQPGDLAYVLFTSGSTGRPKGVMIPHRAIVNHMQWMRAELPLSANDVVLQRTAPTFDASVWEFFLPLITGARLLLGSADAQRDPAEILRTIARERVTVLQAVPTLLAEIAREAASSRIDSLRLVFAGGEALTSELATQLAEVTGAEVINLYGPTEACIDASFHRCVPGHDALTQPIGRPIANARMFVVDERMQPRAIGIPGELLIAGAGLAHGYIGRPDLTAERFVRDPFGDDNDARAYRTGDLVRRLRDGSLEFLGRIDDQVKIRGYRIELGEIEAILREIVQADAVVTVQKTASGEAALAAYTTSPAPESELRRALAEKLPAYMIPQAFVRLDALPLLPNGKVDRNALPAPQFVHPSGAVLQPRNETEAALVSIWTEVLNVPAIGVEDNFFHLGGHSLLAIRMLARIRAYMGVDLPVRSVFEQPTLAALAARIAATPATAMAAQPVFEEGAL